MTIVNLGQSWPGGPGQTQNQAGRTCSLGWAGPDSRAGVQARPQHQGGSSLGQEHLTGWGRRSHHLSTWLFQQRGPWPTEEKQKARMRSQGTGRLGGQVTQTACCVHFWHCSPGFPQTQVPTNLGHVYYRTDQRLETRVQFPWAETLDLGQCFLLWVRGSPYPLAADGILHPLLLALWATSEPSTSTSSHGLLLCLWLGGPRVYLRAHLDKARSSPTFSPWAWSHPPDPCSPGHSWESPFRLAHSIFHPSKAPGTPHWWRGKGGGLWESPGQGCLIECYHRVRVNDDHVIIISVQFSSVAQSYPTLYDPMDCSTPGLPVHHHLPELAQTHVHYACDTIQPSHPLSSPSPPAFNISQHQDLFQWVRSSHQVTKVLEFQL